MYDYREHADPLEIKIVRRTIRALKAAGTPVTSVWDGEERVPVRTERETLEAIFAVDESYLYTADKSWVRITLGNSLDVITDYTTDLEEPLHSVYVYVDQLDQRGEGRS